MLRGLSLTKRTCHLTGSNVGSKTRNIANRWLVLQQCCKTSCTFIVTHFSVALPVFIYSFWNSKSQRDFNNIKRIGPNSGHFYVSKQNCFLHDQLQINDKVRLKKLLCMQLLFGRWEAVFKERFSNLREHGQFRFLGNYLPTPPLSQHFALSEKKVLMLT